MMLNLSGWLVRWADRLNRKTHDHFQYPYAFYWSLYFEWLLFVAVLVILVAAVTWANRRVNT